MGGNASRYLIFSYSHMSCDLWITSLPIEILTEVAQYFSCPESFLHDGRPETGPADRAVLNACSLVCRAWTPIAHATLFTHRVVLWPNTYKEFFSLLERIPALATHISNIKIGHSLYSTSRYSYYHNTAVLLTAAQLPRLRKLELFDISSSSLSNETWFALMHKLQTLRIITLTRMMFDTSDRDIASLLAGHPGLRRLHVRESCTCNPTEDYVDGAHHHVDDESHVNEENHVYLPMKRVV
jgi:hypothetical protein